MEIIINGVVETNDDVMRESVGATYEARSDDGFRRFHPPLVHSLHMRERRERTRRGEKGVVVVSAGSTVVLETDKERGGDATEGIVVAFLQQQELVLFEYSLDSYLLLP